jgi:hypothetical protein
VIKTVCVCSREETDRNKAHAAGLGLPWLAAMPPTDVPLAIVGGGQSSGDNLERLLDWPGHIMAVNRAHEWLVANGRTPDSVIALDPHRDMAELFRDPRAGTYYIASMCAPGVFDLLRDRNVILWDAPQRDEEILGPHSVAGGSTALTRAPLLAAQIGYRDISIFGADSCYYDNRTHVYGASMPDGLVGLPDDAIRVECGGQVWITSIRMLCQAEYLAAVLPHFSGLNVRLIGHHLASMMLANDGEWKQVF